MRQILLRKTSLVGIVVLGLSQINQEFLEVERAEGEGENLL